MKNFFRRMLCAVLIVMPLAMQSCTEDDESLEAVVLNLDESMKTLDFTSETKTESITVTAECNTTWEVTFQDEKAEWLSFDTMTGSGDVNFTVSTTEKYSVANSPRKTILVLNANGVKEIITVNQAGIVGEGDVDQDSFSAVDKEGEEIDVVVTSNTKWTAKGTDDVKIRLDDDSFVDSFEYSASEEDPRKTITFVVPQNTNDNGAEEEYNVTIESEYFETITITFNQGGYTQSTISFSDAEQGGKDVTAVSVFKDCTNLSCDKVYVTTDDDSTWSVENRNSDSWFSVARSGEDGFFTIEVTDDNDTNNTRVGYIDITATNGVRPDTKSITITQTTEGVYIGITDEDEVTIAAATTLTDTSKTISSNVECSVSIEYAGEVTNWLKAEFVDGFTTSDEATSTDNTLTITALSDNTSLTPRTATITVKANDDNEKSFDVTQEGIAPAIILTDITEGGTLSIAGEANSTATFSVNANQDWSAALSGDTSSRFTLSDTDGDADTTTEITVTAKEANTTDKAIDETLTITIAGTGGTAVTKSFTVSQQITASLTFVSETESEFVSAISSNIGTYELNVETNVGWKIEFREDNSGEYSDTEITWITAETTSFDATTESATITVERNPSTTTTQRVGHIVLLDGDDVVMDSIKVTQEAYIQLEALMLLLLQDLKGDADVTLSNWGVPNELSDWEGVTTVSECDGVYSGLDDNTVIKLELPNKGLTGKLPDDDNIDAGVVALKNIDGELRVLDLSGNGLSGKVANFYELNNIEHLDLSDNKLTIIHADAVKKMTKIEYLDLSNNSLEASVSLDVELQSVTTLEYFDVHNGGFASVVPDLSASTNLYYYDISDNAFTGTIPAVMATNLTTLKCSGNKMSGVLDAAFALNENYAQWDPMTNVFPQSTDTVDITSEPYSAKLKLNALGVMRAFYWHSISNSGNWDLTKYSDGTAIEWLASDFSFNVTTAYVATKTNGVPSLQWLGGDSGTNANMLSGLNGTLPAELGMINSIEYIVLSGCGTLTGKIPTSVVAKARRLNVAGCGLSNEIGDIFNNMRDIANGSATVTECNLADNDFTGEITEEMQKNIMTYFSTTNNAYSEVPIRLSGNENLSGTLTTEFITWLKGHTKFPYTDEDIVTYITDGTALQLAD